jgi:DnaJ-class molecular chaperone
MADEADEERKKRRAEALEKVRVALGRDWNSRLRVDAKTGELTVFREDPCPVCNGRGRTLVNGGRTWIDMSIDCKACRGTGHTCQ